MRRQGGKGQREEGTCSGGGESSSSDEKPVNRQVSHQKLKRRMKKQKEELEREGKRGRLGGRQKLKLKGAEKC